MALGDGLCHESAGDSFTWMRTEATWTYLRGSRNLHGKGRNQVPLAVRVLFPGGRTTPCGSLGVWQSEAQLQGETKAGYRLGV